MSTLTNILQGICAYHIKKNQPTLPAKSQTETLNTDIFPIGLMKEIDI